MKALSQRASTIQKASYLKPTKGLEQHEIVALLVVMENYIVPDEGVNPYEIVSAMDRAGYRKIAVSLALESLRKKGLVEVVLKLDDHDSGEYQVYKVTESGISWCLANQDKFNLKHSNAKQPPSPPGPDDEDDDFLKRQRNAALHNALYAESDRSGCPGPR